MMGADPGAFGRPALGRAFHFKLEVDDRQIPNIYYL